MRNKALLTLEAALLLFGMLAFQACFEEEPYRYAPAYGHPYENPSYRYGGGYGYQEPYWGSHEEHEEERERVDCNPLMRAKFNRSASVLGPEFPEMSFSDSRRIKARSRPPRQIAECARSRRPAPL